MDNVQESYFGMFLRCKIFLTDNAAAFSTHPTIPGIKTRLDTYVADIIAKDAASSLGSLSTASKEAAEIDLETKTLKAARAGASYFRSLGTAGAENLDAVTVTDSEVKYGNGDKLIAIAKRIFDRTDPVKALLAPHGAAAADITAVQTALDLFTLLERRPEYQIDEARKAGVEVDMNINLARTMLDTELDIYMGPFEFSNNPLFLLYEFCRELTDPRTSSPPDIIMDVLPGATVTLGTYIYEPDRLFTFKAEGTGSIRVSLSTGPAEGPTPLTIAGGDTRQRQSSTMAPVGDNLIAHNPGVEPMTVKVWVD